MASTAARTSAADVCSSNPKWSVADEENVARLTRLPTPSPTTVRATLATKGRTLPLNVPGAPPRSVLSKLTLASEGRNGRIVGRVRQWVFEGDGSTGEVIGQVERGLHAYRAGT